MGTAKPKHGKGVGIPHLEGKQLRMNVRNYYKPVTIRHLQMMKEEYQNYF